jgi:23S rRNA (uracil1939-C5)-methyltransferase
VSAPFRPCPHFGRCGGCQRFEPQYPAEFAAKSVDVYEQLQSALPGVELPPLQPFQAPPSKGPRGFRGRLLWPVQPGRRGQVRAGLYAAGSHELIELERCEVQTPELFALARGIVEIAHRHGLEAYDEKTHSGFFRAIDIRHLPLRGEALVTLVTRGGVWEDAPVIARAIRQLGHEIPTRSHRGFRVAGVVRSIHDETGNRVLGERFVPLLGHDHLVDDIHGLQLRISAGSFYQSNWRAEPLLFAPALDLLGELSGQRAVDLFAGVGAFGLRMLQRGAAHVEFIESHPRGAADAEFNLARSGYSERATLRRADASDPELLSQLDAQLAVLDPPRKGLGEPGARALGTAKLQRLLYVSCYPKSLARDLSVLLNGPWQLRELRSADLFPRTDHLELVALLERR